jgi:site-specific DNA-methyltransferase (adenine-specific)
MSNFQLMNGDCLEILKSLPDDSIDSLVTDPPAGISFMGKSWDGDKGGSKQWIAWLSSVMKEALRVMKPGAHGLVWAIPRTSHWTATALEDAGFEIRDVVTHLFGTGFPKSHNIEKATGDDRFKGWGTALKPASEHWILVRKPCSEDTVAENVLKYGTGGLNIDASRIGIATNEPNLRPNAKNHVTNCGAGIEAFADAPKGKNRNEFIPDAGFHNSKGRFPANLVLSHNSDCVEVGVKKVKGSVLNHVCTDGKVYGDYAPQMKYGKTDKDGTETVPAWECTEGCAVELLDEQSGVLHPGGQKSCGFSDATSKFGIGIGIERNSSFKDSGGASRFFYCAKASKKDKGTDNTHPTVKSTTLMEYLIKMVTPPNGIVLDPFMGSGTTGVAAIQSGFLFFGIEKEEEYYSICMKRLEAVKE